jgi:ribosomal protein S12 methylthiotransferase
LIGKTLDVLVDTPGIARSHREAPEIDGVIHVGQNVDVGSFAQVQIVDALGPDLVASGVERAALEEAD